MGIILFYLPDWTTTTDPLKKLIANISDYLADTLNTQKENTIYYPSSYYQFDTRGVVTINITLNGQVVSQVRYVDALNSPITSSTPIPTTPPTSPLPSKTNPEITSWAITISDLP